MELAVMFVSESELLLADSNYEASWLNTNKDKLFEMLYNLGLDINRDLEYQDITQHRNRLNKVVTCGRYSGLERTDTEWINSGYASRAAKIAASGCKLLGSELNRELKQFQQDKDNASILTKYEEQQQDEE